MTWHVRRPTSVPRPRGVPLRSTTSRTAVATGVASIPPACFSSQPTSVRRSASSRHLGVCPIRDLRICVRSAAPMGFPCTDETLVAPPGASSARRRRALRSRRSGGPARGLRGAGGLPRLRCASDHRVFKERHRRAAVSVHRSARPTESILEWRLVSVKTANYQHSLRTTLVETLLIVVSMWKDSELLGSTTDTSASRRRGVRRRGRPVEIPPRDVAVARDWESARPQR